MAEFLISEVCILMQLLLKLRHMGKYDNKSSLIRVIALVLKSLSEPLMIQFAKAYMYMGN